MSLCEKIGLIGNAIEDELVAYFQVLQSSKANINKTFNFTVSATKLVRRGHLATAADVAANAANNTNYVENTSVVPDGRTYTIDKTVTISAATATAASATANTYLALDDTNSSNGSFSAIYTGYVNPPQAGLELATFTVTWTHDAEAIDGFYMADVTLTVTPE